MLFHLLPSSSLPTLLFISECLFFGACFRRAKDNLSRAVNSKSHSGTPTLRKALHWPPLWIRVIAEGKWPILTLHCGLLVNSYTALRFKTTFPKALEKKLLWSLKIYNFNNNNWKVLKGDWCFFFLVFFFSFFPILLFSDFSLTVAPHCRSNPSLGALTSGKVNLCECQMCAPVC